ncbi:MAG: hypothetical protein K8S21_13045 [Gemmatimonadetes bacterium]|nr:hypothetical protein [Gemmatimonadota bacterium]
MISARELGLALTIALFPASLDAQPRAAPAPQGTVLFICEHGTVKSLLAKLLFDEYAAQIGLPMRAESRGTAIDSAVPPWMLAKLSASDLMPGSFTPRALAAQDLAAASFVVSFDLAGAVVAGARAPRARWDSLPPASQQFEASRDAIRARVHALVDSLDRARRTQRPSPRNEARPVPALPTGARATGFAGTYATGVRVTENACGPVTVMDMPTVVTHDRSSGVIHLVHAGTDYPGTVKDDGSFATTPITRSFDDGHRYVMSIAGRFGAQGFDALVTLDRTTVATRAACRYKVRWFGTRSLSPA